MDEDISSNTTPRSVIDQLNTAVAEAKQGKVEALPHLQRLLEDHPEVWRYYGDLTRHVEDKWLDLLAGDDAAVRESVRRSANELRTELLDDGDSPLEKLLVDRIIVSQLMTRFFDAAMALAVNEPEARVRFFQQQLDRAQKRHSEAVKALAEVRKLLSTN